MLDRVRRAFLQGGKEVVGRWRYDGKNWSTRAFLLRFRKKRSKRKKREMISSRTRKDQKLGRFTTYSKKRTLLQSEFESDGQTDGRSVGWIGEVGLAKDRKIGKRLTLLVWFWWFEFCKNGRISLSPRSLCPVTPILFLAFSSIECVIILLHLYNNDIGRNCSIKA